MSHGAARAAGSRRKEGSGKCQGMAGTQSLALISEELCSASVQRCRAGAHGRDPEALSQYVLDDCCKAGAKSFLAKDSGADCCFVTGQEVHVAPRCCIDGPGG